MAAQPLRPRRHPRRTHGIHPCRKTLLQRVHWSSPETMIFALTFLPRSNHNALVILRLSDEDSRRTSTARSSPISATTNKLSRNPFLYLLTLLYFLYLPIPASAQNFDKPVTNIDEEVTAFAYAPN